MHQDYKLKKKRLFGDNILPSPSQMVHASNSLLSRLPLPRHTDSHQPANTQKLYQVPKTGNIYHNNIGQDPTLISAGLNMQRRTTVAGIEILASSLPPMPIKQRKCDPNKQVTIDWGKSEFRPDKQKDYLCNPQIDLLDSPFVLIVIEMYSFEIHQVRGFQFSLFAKHSYVQRVPQRGRQNIENKYIQIFPQ